MDKIIIRGAREHNLKNINLDLPRNKLVVFTGISGSGKSTLAFDTIFAEGQRRYLESLSSYARQFLGQMEKPEVDSVEGLSPAISISQKSTSQNPRSTVGTVTEIHDYLRLLYAKIGIPHCSICQKEITKLSIDEIVDKIMDINQIWNSKSKEKKEIEILSPIVRGRKGEYATLLLEMWKRGFSQAYVNGKKYRLNPKTKISLERYKKHNIDIKVDLLEVSVENISRLFESVEKALKLSQGFVKIKIKTSKFSFQEVIYNQKLSCPEHDIEFPELEPRLFSFNSPFGACPTCGGLGAKKEINPQLVAPDKNKTIAGGGIMPWNFKRNNYYGGVILSAARYFNIPENVRLRDLSERKLNILLYGTPETKEFFSTEDADEIPITIRAKTGTHWKFNMLWKGVVGFLQERYFKTDSDAAREDIEKYMSHNPCSLCRGSRYKKESLLVSVGGKNIHEISILSVEEALKFFQNLKFSEKEKKIAGRIIKEIQDRLSFLDNVGLGYLTLARSANTLAGGETQRIRLASQIGSRLVGVLYILDEPSIGLHARDNAKLLNTLLNLRDLGNTLIVIEHDEETMRKADWIVDIGPGAGKNGGEIVAQGSPEEIINHPTSITAKYLRSEMKIEIPKSRRLTRNKKWLVVRGARENNLKNITVEFPLKSLTVVTGVSGSGKSSLVEDVLYKNLAFKIMRSLEKPGKCAEIIGDNYINKIIMIDQSPIGRTPRSNPATYTGLFTLIREIFAKTKEAKTRGYSAARFSFNVSSEKGGGRCDNCQGEGFIKVEMQFLPDVYLTCDICRGKRYNSETLQVKYKNKNIADILEMTVSEGKDFFQNFYAMREKLTVLEDVGLGYIQLGQAATTLSGGEAQRIKLAAELSRRASGDTLYILDEPTTGLHFDDVKKLLEVLNRLVDAGNTVVVIEHNLDVIKTADWIIDLGPEGGEHGGKVVIVGTPEEIIKYPEKSHTARYLKKVLN